jgi:hypothetical protein
VSFGLLLSHQHVNFDEVLEFKRLEIIAFGLNARPAERRIDLLHHDGVTERSVERVLGGLHVLEKVRVMNDAGHVRLGELHAPLDFEVVRHQAG